MKIGFFILNDELREDPRMRSLLKDLESATFDIYEIHSKADVLPETDLVLSMGGDGTFLSAAHVVADIGLPILGVNFGRIGFLCENRPEAVRKALLEGDFRIEYRTVLNAQGAGSAPFHRYAALFGERSGAAPQRLFRVGYPREYRRGTAAHLLGRRFAGSHFIGLHGLFPERGRSHLPAGYQGPDHRSYCPAQPQCATHRSA
jgi:hypothetical protein